MHASVSALVAMLLLAGCQSYLARGYRFHGYGVVGASEREVAQVKQILSSIAAQTQLPAQAPTSLDSAVIALYGDSRVQLRASRQQDDYIHIAVIRWPTSVGSAFIIVDGAVRGTLSSTFGSRFSAEQQAAPTRTIVTQ